MTDNKSEIEKIYYSAARIAAAISSIDGEIAEDELTVITHGLVNLGVPSDIIIDVFNNIENLIDHIASDIQFIAGKDTSLQNYLFEMGKEVVLADGNIDESEMTILSLMAEAWDIDL